MIGRRLRHYRILEKLGEGGMGEVYLAEDTSLDRRVALKFLSETLRSDEAARRRFVREAKSAAALDHPFICKIFEAGRSDDRDYIAMEYVAGRSLKERLAEGPLSLEEFFRLAGEVTEALEEAHARRIVRRDLKPANIMLTPGGHTKVMDFGLAKRLGEEFGPLDREPTRTLTRQGSAVGTLAYMAPEQIAGEQADVRSDLFSLGVVFYESLLGKHPFRRSNIVETMGAILGEEPPPLRESNREIPERLGATVRRMLAKGPAQRPQTIVEVRTELAEAFEHWVGESGKVLSGRPEPGSARRRRLFSGGLAEIRPYPGLSAFTEREAGQFFGREEEVAALWGRIRSRTLLGVIGPSGTGKTSFLRAGVLAERPEGWAAVYATPGANPVLGLARALTTELAGDAEATSAPSPAGRTTAPGEAGTQASQKSAARSQQAAGREPLNP